MFVGMWMTRDVFTVGPTESLAKIAMHMAERKIRRLPVVAPSPEGPRLLGMVTHADVLHAFPADINPFAVGAAENMAALEASTGKVRVTAEDLMARDPLVTAPDAPIESAARLMRDRKIGALPVVSRQALAGIITESDVFRALVEVFETADRAVRITFSLTPGEDVLPLIADIARRRAMRVTSFMSLPQLQPPVCVVQLVGSEIAETLEDVWNSKHRVMSIVHLGTDPAPKT